MSKFTVQARRRRAGVYEVWCSTGSNVQPWRSLSGVCLGRGSTTKAAIAAACTQVGLLLNQIVTLDAEHFTDEGGSL